MNKKIQTFSKKIDSFSIKDLIEIGNTLLNKLKKIDKNLSIEIDVNKITKENKIFNSNNLHLEGEKNFLSVTASIFKPEENNFIEIYDAVSLKNDEDIYNEIEKMLGRMKFLYSFSGSQTKLKEGKYNVIFTPKAFSTILEMILLSFNGDLIYKNISFFSDKKNKKVFKIPVNILDNPLLDNYPASYNFDGDGLEGKKIFLIENGIVKNFLLDLQTAGKLKISSNGHSFRSYSSLPKPSYSNIFFFLEDKRFIDSFENIINSSDNVILVDQFLGAGQSNIISGEFSVNIELAFLIENGKIKGRVKDCMLAGNLFEILDNIKKITKESIYYSGIESPFVFVENLSIR